MENILIETTKNTPQIDFSNLGNLTLSGSAYPENAKDFFDPLIEWVSSLQTEEVNFDIKLDYINTAAAKKLLELLKTLEANDRINRLNLRWHYENEDEDCLETGQIMEDSLRRIKFQFVEY